MQFEKLEAKLVKKYGVEKSTMMNTPCLRFKGQFIAMMFEKEEALIVKVPESRVNELISEKIGREFNFTKKRFREWVLIPKKHEKEYEHYILESLEYAKTK